jgi:hypothetical protein
VAPSGRGESSAALWDWSASKIARVFSHTWLVVMFVTSFMLVGAPMTMAQTPAPPGAPTQSVPLPHPDIAPPDFVSPTFTPWWLVLGGIVMGLGLLALLVWFAFLPKTYRPPSLRHAPLKSAMESLEALRGRVHEMQPSEVAHDVSLIIRMYLQHSYSVPAPYRTTEEIYRSAALSTREPLKNRFEPVAVFYDQVEFAPRPRTVEDSEGLVEAALEALREEQKLLAQPAFSVPVMKPSLSPPPLPPPAPAAPPAPPPPPSSAASVLDSTSAPEPPKISLSKP